MNDHIEVTGTHDVLQMIMVLIENLRLDVTSLQRRCEVIEYNQIEDRRRKTK